MRETLRKSEILRGRETFSEVFEHGRKYAGSRVACYVLLSRETAVPGRQLVAGFVVRRTVRRAIDRNRLKRLLRESFRRHKSSLHLALQNLSVSLSIVFMLVPKTSDRIKSLSYKEVEKEVSGLITSIANDLRG